MAKAMFAEARNSLIDLGEGARQSETAELLRHRNTDETRLDIFPIGVLEPARRGDVAILAVAAPLPISGRVDRQQHLFAVFGRCRVIASNIGRSVGKARQIAEPLDVEDVIEQKKPVRRGACRRAWDLLRSPGRGRYAVAERPLSAPSSC